MTSFGRETSSCGGSGTGAAVSGFLRRFSAGAGTSSGGRGWGTGIPWVSRVWAVGGRQGVFPWVYPGTGPGIPPRCPRRPGPAWPLPGGSGRWGPGSGGIDAPGHGEHVPPRLQGPPGGDEGTAGLRALHHHHPQAQPGNEAVAHRKMGACAGVPGGYSLRRAPAAATSAYRSSW